MLGATNVDSSLAIELFGSTTVRGTVFAPDGSTPAAGVLLTATDNETGTVLERMLTDTDGDYTLIVR